MKASPGGRVEHEVRREDRASFVDCVQYHRLSYLPRRLGLMISTILNPVLPGGHWFRAPPSITRRWQCSNMEHLRIEWDFDGCGAPRTLTWERFLSILRTGCTWEEMGDDLSTFEESMLRCLTETPAFVTIVLRREESGAGDMRARYLEVAMETMELEVAIPKDLFALLGFSRSSAVEAIKEFSVLGLYLEQRISAGKAAELMGLRKREFVRLLARKGIRYLDYTDEELEKEFQSFNEWQRERTST